MWILILVAVLPHSVVEAKGGSGCGKLPTPAVGQPPLPALVNTYEVHIEMKSVTENTTTSINEYFNGTTQQLAVRQTLLGVRVYSYFHYALDELLTVVPQEGTCVVTNISTSKLSYLFGDHGNASSILQLGRDTTQVYQGTDTVRGIRVRKWCSCQTWDAFNATMNVTWYFSDPASWDTGIGLEAVPVRAWVQGHSGHAGGHKYFEQIFDMFHFNDLITTKDALQVPDLIYCGGRRVHKAMPSIPSSFSVQVELVETNTKLLSNIEIWLDTQMKLGKHIYNQKSAHLANIQDFNTGVAYVMDLERGNCSVSPIGVHDATTNKGRIQTAAQAFMMDVTDAVYTGVEAIRGISTDVFVATRTDYPPEMPQNTTLEWFFSQKEGTSLAAGTLLQMRMNMPQIAEKLLYNLFYLTPYNTDLNTWDVSSCYQNLPRRVFQFSVSGTYGDQIQASPDLFKYAVVLSVMGQTGVSPLRIANVQLENKKEFLVNFDMLGVAPVPVRANVTQTPLGVAGDMLRHAFHQNKFSVYLPDTNKPFLITPVPNSFKEISVNGPPAASTPSHMTAPTTASTVMTIPATASNYVPLPSFPFVYDVIIQKIMPEIHMSTETAEAFNNTANQLSQRHKAEGAVTQTIINLSNKEVRTINMQKRTCKVSGLGAGNLSDLVGYTGDAQGKGRIFSLAGTFLYDKGRNYTYVGRDVIRGIAVRSWSVTNINIDGDNNNNMDVMWYFADPNAWDTALNWPNAPVRATVVGEDERVTPTLDYVNIYNFFHFKNFLQIDDPFETPDLITCPGRTPKRSFPAMAPAASFTAETVDDTGHIRRMEESYDTKLRVTKYTYTQAPGLYDTDVGPRVTDVHDFTTGVAYVTNTNTGTCTCRTIEKNSFGAISKNEIYVQMKTASQIFHMDFKDYSYEGQITTRDIPTERFVAVRTDYPPQTTLSSTFEWRFASSQYARVQQSQETFTGGVPVQIQISVPEDNVKYTYNIYNFIQARPNLLNWDIRSCYRGQEKRILQFSIPGSYSSQISSSRETFKHETLSALQDSLKVSPLRINDIHLQTNFTTTISVRFTLLGTAPIEGDVNVNITETSLDSAVAKLAQLIKDHAFMIPAVFGSHIEAIAALPKSFRDITEEGKTTAISATTSPAASATKSPTKILTTGVPQTKSLGKTSKASTIPVPHPGKSSHGQGLKPTTAKLHITTPGLYGSSLANILCGYGHAGYKTGVVVGVSVAMVIVGGVLGTGAAIYMSRRRHIGFR
ncbi:uncharacterized protein LOC124113178 isoform X2 [Haliotis rufescens]|uniref:uncharacterized protein LOC124113178 isoform X2 n=1 Tax=Haliotis rufescens TaxID=6454 RepID=UPI00201ED3F1|nr:uncharacterized protein LOC124113178 isoform X2 [Haliotis rufescens]